MKFSRYMQMKPLHGSVAVESHITGLPGLGSGFNPEFTGREIVYLNGGRDEIPLSEERDELPSSLPAAADKSICAVSNDDDAPLSEFIQKLINRIEFNVHASPQFHE